MSKKMILSGFVGAVLTAGAGLAAWVGTPLFDSNDAQTWPIDMTANQVQIIFDVADFDNDGFDDLLVLTSSNQLEVLLNQSGTGFTSVFQIASGSAESERWKALDANGDGYPDLVKLDDHEATVLINQLALLAACPSDLDKTGATEVGDLLFIIDRWGVCGDS